MVPTQSRLESIFPGNSEMACRMREFDWSSNPLGPPEQWPLNLKTSVRITLTSRHPMFVWWGPQLINLYNDGYAEFLHARHPWALGQPAAEIWAEVWPVIGPRAEYAMRRDEGTYDEALPFVLTCKGYPEEAWATFSYSPIPDDHGGVGGILCPVTEETQRIIGERQIALLRELAAKTADARSVEEACGSAARALETDPADLPFALIYVLDSSREFASLLGGAGLPEGESIASPASVALGAPCLWPLADAFRNHEERIVSDLEDVEIELPRARGGHVVKQAAVLRVAPSGDTGREAALVVGLNPLRQYDDSYRGFLQLVANGISAALANAQSYEAERRRAEQLAELDRAKTVFFSNISHEFRTPLALILGPLEEELRENPQSAPRLQPAYRNSVRLLKLVNTLLDFSRIEAGSIDATFEPVDLAGYTAELASVFRSAFEQAGVDLHADCPALDDPVFVDRGMWEKIVLNLLSNAFKFTFEGSVSVALRTSGNRVQFTVKDTGVGIPASELPRIFERFHRARVTRARTFEGTGIGLAMVQELVRLHGGEIGVESTEGEGTTFTVTLPRGDGHLPPERVVRETTAGSSASAVTPFLEEAMQWLPQAAEDGAAKTGAGGSRILLADDNADMRAYIRRVLGARHDVVAVGDGEAALQALAEQLPDLVIADVIMPNLDGFELLTSIRADERTRTLPVILLSARAGEEARVEGLRHGADDYLIKPFSARELEARVSTHLELARMRKATDTALQQSQAELERRVEERTWELLMSEQLLAAELERAHLLQRISTQLVEADNVGALYEQILASTASLGADFASIQTLDPERGAAGGLRLMGHRGFSDAAAAFWRVVRLDSGSASGEVLRTRHRAIIEDVENCDFTAGTHDLEIYRQNGIRAVQSTPIYSRSGVMLGAFSTHWRAPHRVSVSESRTLDVLARLIADLLERHQAEQALREKEERFRLFVENVQEHAFLQSDPGGRITEWNPGAERLFKYSVAEVLGMPVAELFAAEDRAAGVIEQELERVHSGSRIEQTRWMTRKDGSQFWALCVAEPVTDSAGKLRGVAHVLRDETKCKRTEEALRRSLADTEALLKEVHHRVKNNLQVISSLFQLQVDQISDPRILAVFDNARNRVAAIAMIHELLYRSGSFESVDLGEYTRQLLPSLVRFYDVGDVVSASVTGGGIRVELDRAVSYGLLLSELVSNTCKHAFPNQARGRIDVTLTDHEDRIVVRVRDTGIGLPPGFNYENSYSLGGQLVAAFARRLSAVLEVQPGPGAAVELRFPVHAADGEDE
ncbi:MAG TPA: ATP-binding protein [Bryobacteraceae bacterium]|nr:ATP-binding protein [Bryobacteraceae bacterium]